MVNDDFAVKDVDEAPEAGETQQRAKSDLVNFIEEHKNCVFYSRQIEVKFEDTYFHWVTNRALRDLVAEDVLRTEARPLRSGGSIKILWHKSYRYYKRYAKKVVGLVEEYADPNIGAALGLQGEFMVLEGFARNRFVMTGRNTRRWGESVWEASEHDLDFIFEKDAKAYGIEVKNTLTYMDRDEFNTKIELCQSLGITPVFVVRMLPSIWISELVGRGGFALVLKHQLYPWAHKALAQRVARELDLPVDTPRALWDATMARFVKWHEANV